MAPQESALLRRFCASGDAEAFAELVQRYAGLVYSTCWRVLKDETDAADATQETFFELTRHAGRITGSLAGWLHKVARQKSIDHLRRGASRRRREEAYARNQRVEVRSWQELSGHVDEALDELDGATKSLLLERFVLGKSAPQIAREHGGSKATVCRRINAGLTQLRGALRRKGLLVATGAVVTLLTESASQAVSATALQGLGKMAMVGTTEAASAGAKAGMAKVAIFTIVTAIVSLSAYMHLGTSRRPEVSMPIRVNSGSSGREAASASIMDPAPQIEQAVAIATAPITEASGALAGGVTDGPAAGDAIRQSGEHEASYAARPVGASVVRCDEGRQPTRAPMPARTLHFAGEQSIGVVYLQDENLVVPEIVKGFHPGHSYAEMENTSCAQGEVQIPAGKRVILCVRGVGVTPERYLAAIESLGPDDLYGLQFFSVQPIAIADHLIEPLARLRGLRWISLGSVRVGPRGLSALAQLPNVERFDTPYGLTDEGMAEVAKMSSLRILNVSRDRLTDNGLALLGRLKALESLELYGNPRMTDDGLEVLTRLNRLWHVRLGAESPFTDRAMVHLAALPSLKTLWLDTHNVGDEGLRLLSRSRSLERLNLHWLDRISAQGVAHLKNAAQLKALDIDHATFTEADLSAVTALSNLEHLVLPHCTFSDAALARLASLDRLKYLWINCSSHSPLTDEALRAVRRMNGLQQLYIGGTGFTNEGIALLGELKHLSALHLAFWRGLDNETLQILARFPALRELSWSGSDHVTLSGLNALNDLTALESLSADEVRQDRAGLDLSRLRNLKTLRITMRQQWRNVNGDPVPTSDLFYDGDLASLGHLSGLETLSLCGRGIGDEGVAHLAPLTRIKYLDIGGGTELTDAGLTSLSAMRRLDVLRIYQSRISERGLAFLYPLKTIHILQISTTVPIGADALSELRMALPHLQQFRVDRPELARMNMQRQTVSSSQVRRDRNDIVR